MESRGGVVWGPGLALAMPDALPDPFADGLPTLDGKRVRLRAVRPADDADLLAVFGDAEHLRFWSHGPLADLDAAREYRAEIASGTADRSLFQWAITAPPDDQLLGTTTLYAWDRSNRHAEIGFILRPEAAGQGLASDAVRTVIQFAIDRMHIHRIEADVDPDNDASIRLLTRLGFVYEGRLRDRWFTFFGEWKDSAMYGLLAPDLDRG